MSKKTAEELLQKVIKNFLDIFILAELDESEIGGYDIIKHIHKRHGVLISSGTVYSTLYKLERDGLIKSQFDERKRVYELTKKGIESLKSIKKANDEIGNLLGNILSLNEKETQT